MTIQHILHKTRERLSGLSETKKNSLYYSTSNYITSFINLIKSFVLAKILGPTLMGEVAAVSLITTYGVNLHLGTYSAINQKVPYLRGKGEKQLAENYKNTAFVFTLFMSLTTFIFLSIFAYFSHLKEIYKFGFYLLGLSLPLYFIYNFKIGLLRYRYEFKKIAIYQILQALFLITVALSTVKFISNKAAILGIFVSYIIIDLIMYLRRQEWFCFYFDLRLFINLLKLGIPLIAMGFFYDIFSTVDRVMIIKYLDITKLGLYTFPLGMAAFYYLGGNAVNSVLYQKMLVDYGKTSDLEVVNKTLLKGALAIALISPIIGFAIEGGAYFLIDNFLPRYFESKSILNIIIPPSLFMAVSPMFSTALITVGKHMYILYSQISLVLIAIALNYIFIKILHLSIQGVTYATSICFIIYCLLLIVISKWKIKQPLNFMLKNILSLLLIFSGVLAIKYVIRLIAPSEILIGNINFSGLFFLVLGVGLYGMFGLGIYTIQKRKVIL